MTSLSLPSEIQDAWLCWRLILSGQATHLEVASVLSIDDVDLHCELLDLTRGLDVR